MDRIHICPLRLQDGFLLAVNAVQFRCSVMRCLKEKQGHYFILRKSRLEGSYLFKITQMIWAQNTKPLFSHTHVIFTGL